MRIVRGLLAIIGGLVVLVAIVWAAALWLEPDRSKFDPERWVAEGKAEPDDNRRSLMLADLERRLRPGMDEADVLDLLGPPDVRTGDRIGYTLGRGGYGVDYDTYMIEFDAGRRVRRYWVDRG